MKMCLHSLQPRSKVMALFTIDRQIFQVIFLFCFPIEKLSNLNVFWWQMRTFIANYFPISHSDIKRHFFCSELYNFHLHRSFM